MTDTDCVRDVVDALEADGWDVSASRVRADTVVLAADRDADAAASTLLGLVVDADTEVAPKYVKYLVKTASDRDADAAFLSTVGTVTPEARATAEEYGVTVVDPEAVGASAPTSPDASTADAAAADSAAQTADNSPEAAPADTERTSGADRASGERNESDTGSSWESWAIDDEGSAADSPAADAIPTDTPREERPEASEPMDGGGTDGTNGGQRVDGPRRGGQVGGHEPRATAEQWDEPPRQADSLLARLTSGRGLVIVVALLAVGLVVGGTGTGPLAGQATDGTPGQSRAADTARESTQRAPNRVEVVSATGSVSDGTVDTVTLTLRLAPGSNSLDLSNATVGWNGPNETGVLRWGESATDRTFTTRAVTGESATVLDEQDDRVRLSVDADAITGGLEPGSTVELTIRTAGGRMTVFTATVPNSVDGRRVVTL